MKALLEQHPVADRAENMATTEVELSELLYDSGISLVRLVERIGFNAQTVQNQMFRAAVQIRGAHERRLMS